MYRFFWLISVLLISIYSESTHNVWGIRLPSFDSSARGWYSLVFFNSEDLDTSYREKFRAANLVKIKWLNFRISEPLNHKFAATENWNIKEFIRAINRFLHLEGGDRDKISSTAWWNSDPGHILIWETLDYSIYFIILFLSDF